jgi:hypothetical protein
MVQDIARQASPMTQDAQTRRLKTPMGVEFSAYAGDTARDAWRLKTRLPGVDQTERYECAMALRGAAGPKPTLLSRSKARSCDPSPYS